MYALTGLYVKQIFITHSVHKCFDVFWGVFTHQAITWTSVGLLSIGTLTTNISVKFESKCDTSLCKNAFGKVAYKVSFNNGQCFQALHELTHWGRVTHPGWRIYASVPNHYLNQYWFIVNWTLRNKLQWNFNQSYNSFGQENAFENVVRKLAAILSWRRNEMSAMASQITGV